MSKFWIQFVLHVAWSMKCICHPCKHTNLRFERNAARLNVSDDAYIPSSVLFKMTIQQATSQQATAGPPVTLNFSLPTFYIAHGIGSNRLWVPQQSAQICSYWYHIWCASNCYHCCEHSRCPKDLTTKLVNCWPHCNASTLIPQPKHLM